MPSKRSPTFTSSNLAITLPPECSLMAGCGKGFGVFMNLAEIYSF
jgi:hypothetical protein